MGKADECVRPCAHNDWDDVRTRNGFKMLRCRECQGKWRLACSDVNRCMAFLHNCCSAGATCGLLHLRRRKCNVKERFEQFGECVLQNAARTTQIRTIMYLAYLKQSSAKHRATESADSLRTTSPVSSHSSVEAYTHCPYSWGSVTPPEFL
eukprot:TRINITY_DN2090_c0_g2_i1.p1 TRINITY_DN2090_c0_g2~~TRINITY_DN2090_c0_g2_i1.p1  ORF type:complete len:151 (+),score=22.11 TRINITY_DN2090_c0_g2_i1:79-531(+)